MTLKRGDWFKLGRADDWGVVYFSAAPLTAAGTASVRRTYRLVIGEPVEVRLRDGTERAGKIAARSEVFTIRDMGRDYSGASSVLHVEFDDGTEAQLDAIELRYEPERDPTA